MTAVATAETASPPELPEAAGRTRRLRFDPKGKTAVILVSGFNGTGLHTLFSVKKVFGEVFRNWFFIQAGIVDADRFKGAAGIDELRTHVEEGLDRYVRFLKAEGMFAQGFSAIGTDVSDEICGLAQSHLREASCRRFLRRPDRFRGGQLPHPPAFQPHHLRRAAAPPPAGDSLSSSMPGPACQ